MPDRAIHKIMTATEPADVATMAMIECLRSLADGNKKTGQVLEGMQAELRDVRERVIRIEASEFKLEVQEARAAVESAKREADLEIAAIDKRVLALEADKNRRDGALSLVEWVGRNWPAIIGFVLLIGFVALANGRLHL